MITYEKAIINCQKHLVTINKDSPVNARHNNIFDVSYIVATIFEKNALDVMNDMLLGLTKNSKIN